MTKRENEQQRAKMQGLKRRDHLSGGYIKVESHSLKSPKGEEVGDKEREYLVNFPLVKNQNT